MNYTKIYNHLMERARFRILPKDTYTENHHILPKCIGGTNHDINLLELTPEEHYICHQLLVKMHPHHRGLVHAAIMLSGGYNNRNNKRNNNKAYGWMRRKLSEATKGIPKTYKNGMKGKKKGPLSDEIKQKISKSKQGQIPHNKGKKTGPRSEEIKQKISNSMKGKPSNTKGKRLPTRTKEHRQKLSNAMCGRELSKETIKKRTESRKRNRNHLEADND